MPIFVTPCILPSHTGFKNIFNYDPQSAGINLQSHQSDSTPWTLTLMRIQRRWRLFTELIVLTALSTVVRALKPAKPPGLLLSLAWNKLSSRIWKKNSDIIIQNFLNQNLSQNDFDKWNNIKMSKTLQIFRIESWICYDLIRLHHRLFYKRLYQHFFP